VTEIDFVDVRLWRADAVVLFDWLMRADLDAVRFDHPAQRQALSDLFGRLGHVLDVPSRAQVDQALQAVVGSQTEHPD
jgi:hypothetical protein